MLYKLYRLDTAGQQSGPGEAIELEDGEAARQNAMALANGLSGVEIWDDERLVVRLSKAQRWRPNVKR